MAEGKQVVASGGEDEGVSMLDVLEEDQFLEDEANAVLGGSDEKYCTYGQGMVGRQALYACTTCITPDMEPAGICLACSYDCHEGHDLVEMYTKRNFRCDCGNGRFANLTCKFYPNKAAVNADNEYNQNFRGVYCICNRPYPDPEDDTEDEMIQCILCEDWFHGRHLGTQPPDHFDYQEMICKDCMKKCDFLWTYSASDAMQTKVIKKETTAPVDVESVPEPASGSLPCTSQAMATKEEKSEAAQVNSNEAALGEDASPSVNGRETVEGEGNKANQEQSEDGGNGVVKTTADSSVADKKTDTNDKTEKGVVTASQNAGSPGQTSDKPSREAGGSTQNADTSEKMGENNQEAGTSAQTADGCARGSSVCKLEELRKRDVKVGNHATFWPQGWRKKLCTCTNCQKMYTDRCITFLLEESDTVCFYEEKGKSNQAAGSQYEQGMRVFSGMDRVQQVEVLHGYNDMKTELKNYLQSFAQQGRVVKQEDIAEFFESMQARKRQRVDSGPQFQYFCR